MLAEKPLISASNSSKFHLPSINKRSRRRYRSPLLATYNAAPVQAMLTTENVSALKEKYAGYSAWLKTSHRSNQEPVLTHELLKTSLCQMGIDSAQAEQLVTKCTWYVYQFQKSLKVDPERRDFLTESERQKRSYAKKPVKKLPPLKDNIEDSTTTFSSFDKDDSFLSNPIPRIRTNYSVLPGANNYGSSTSSRFRRVDFGDEQVKNCSGDPTPMKHRYPLANTQKVLKLQPLPVDTSDDDTQTSSNFDFYSQSNTRRTGFVNGNLRSILRKQPSIAPSTTSTDVSNRKMRSRILTPSSTIIDDIPLGTRSQRLFGGSECFAQIMNELEQQKNSS